MSFFFRALLYFFYFMSSFTFPSLSHRLPIKLSMIVCSAIYVFYIASINLGQDVIFMFSSSVIGVCAGLFWLKSSEWIAQESLRLGGGVEGFLTGTFYGVFYFQGILGCGIALIILQFQVMEIKTLSRDLFLICKQANISVLIWCMSCLTGVGFVMMLFLPVETTTTTTITTTTTTTTTTVAPPSLREKFAALLKSASQPSVLLLVPIIFLQSAQVCYSYMFMPRLIRACTSAEEFPFVNVSTFTVYWVASIIVSFSYGKLFDQFGWRVVLCCVAVVELLCLASSLPLMLVQLPSPYLWMIVGFFRGLSDTGTNSFVLATITFRYASAGSASALFGLYRGLYSFGFFLLGIATALISPLFLVGGLALLLVTGTICFVISFRFPVVVEIQK
jgi:hypothetical protein